MKNLLIVLMFILTTGSAFAQNIAEQSVAPKNYSIIGHLKDFSWLYITVFVALVGFFVVAYMFGWDKKLFKAKGGDDNHMFI